MTVNGGNSTDLWSVVKDEPGSLRVLQITDTHLFSDRHGRLVGVNTEASHAAIMERILSDHWPVDLVLATGDLVHDGAEAAYRRFKHNLEELGVRTLVIPGNHDDPALMRRVFDGGRVTWSENAVLGRWQFIMLDSRREGDSGGHLGAEQLDLLDRRLSQHPAHHALVCLHHHPVAVGSAWIDRIGVADADALFAVLDRHPQVRALVWGHVHQAFDGERNGVRLLGSPSTCIQFQPGSTDFALDRRPAGFRWLQLHASGCMDTAVVRLSRASGGMDLQCEGYR